MSPLPQPMRLRIKGQELLARSKTSNPHQLALSVQMAAPTVHRYVVQSDRVLALDLQVFPSLVMRALNMSQEQFLDMKIGDLFEFVEEQPTQ
jgi:hypothetical protein